MAIDDNKDKTILYADYSERNIRAASSAIKPLGIGKFIQCDDRERTVELVQELKPDLVLIGLYLDGMRGISTIRAIREAATTTNPHGRNVPVLLGAPKLDRRGMRDAVDAGIEGIFRQPVDPQRLCKIIETVFKKPRRFVFEDNYFGPARIQDLAKLGIKPDDDEVEDAEDDAKDDGSEQGRRKSDQIRAAAGVVLKNNGIKRPAGSTAPAASQASKPAATGVAGNLEIADVRATLNGAGQKFDSDELVGGSSVRDHKEGALNIKAANSTRDVLAPQPAAVAKPADEALPTEAEPDDEPVAEDEELVEIDLQEALISHKLWVDTGGKEGLVMSIEHADLREAELEGIDLSRCGLPFACFQRANCKNAVLRRCNLIAADFVESNLDNANLAASRLSGARFQNALLRNTVFLGSDLSNTSFRGLQLINCDLSGTNLSGADFRDADLSGARGLFAEQIQRARVNANTRLPRGLKLRD